MSVPATAVYNGGIATTPDGAVYVQHTDGATMANPIFTGTVSHTSAPIYQSYNLGVAGDANYERINFTWVANTFYIQSANGGTGTNRSIALRTDGVGSVRVEINAANLWTFGSTGAGYSSGQGGTVTQGAGSGKATGVTLSKTTGQITMDAAALNAATTVSFTLTNTHIAAPDVLILNHVSGGTAGAYTLNAQCAAGSASINVRNVTAGSLSEAVVIAFVLIKGQTT